MNRKLLGLMSLILIVFACDQSFDPKGQFESTLAVYGVLSTGSDTALIRVVHTYDPLGFDPYGYTNDPSLTDATVSLSKEDTAYAVRDTMIIRSDKSRYTSDIKAYVAQPFPVEFGKRYSLLVTSPTFGTFTATATIPGKGAIIPTDLFMLDDTMSYRNDTLFVYVGLSPVTRGYLLSAFLEFEDGSVLRRTEVPTLYHPVTSEPKFPSLRRRTTPEGRPGLESTPENLFHIMAFIRTSRLIHAAYPGSAIIRRAVFVVNQVEPNFYNYYSVVNGFKDDYSIRLDEPGFTNIIGGEGVFGGFTVEELSYDLIPQNW